MKLSSRPISRFAHDAYFERIGNERWENNRHTSHNVEEVGPIGEKRGAYAEGDIQLRFDMPLVLGTHYDGGVDVVWHDLRINVKSTRLYSWRSMQGRNLQWPEDNPYLCDVAILVGVNLNNGLCIPQGWATIQEIMKAPLNKDRPTPCQEILIPNLHQFEALKYHADHLSNRHLVHSGSISPALYAAMDAGRFVVGAGSHGRRLFTLPR